MAGYRGNLDIVGAGGYSVVGADQDLMDLLASSGEVLEGAEAEAVATRAMGRSAVVVRESMPSKLRMYPLGFDSVDDVAALGQTTINSQPQVTYRVERLIVPSDIGGSFVLNDVIVGKNSQFANDIGVPARIFGEQAVGVRLRGDTAQTSQNVVIKAENITNAAIRFRAACIGTALDT